MSTEELKQYVKYIKMMETKKYELTLIYNRLNLKISQLKNKKYVGYKEKVHYNNDDPVISGLVCIPICAILGLLVGFVRGMIKEDDFILFRILVALVDYSLKSFGWGLAIGVVLWLIITIGHSVLEDVSVKKANKEIDIFNRQVAKKNEVVKQQDREKIRIYISEGENIRNQYNEIQNVLKEAYELNIIHPKYRNLVAVCSLYEYLETGRCSTLSGHEGGYNIFEMEKRMNIIMLKLDQIVQKLDEIRENQHTLYEAVSLSNKNAERICNQVTVVSEQLGNIEQNQAMIEYNNSITANNTEFLKWLAFFKG